MGQINLGSGSYKDYAEWTQSPAGKQSLASHQAKYGDQSMSHFPRLWQPDQNWQQQLAEYRGQQAGPPVIGNAPNGRPVTGAVTTAPQPAKAPDMSAYSPGRAQPQQTSQARTTYVPNPYTSEAAWNGIASKVQQEWADRQKGSAMAAYSPGRAQPQQTSQARTTYVPNPYTSEAAWNGIASKVQQEWADRQKGSAMAAYSPGRAQPQQTSQGTPYGQPATLAPVLQPPGKPLKGPGTAQPKTTPQGSPYRQPAAPQPNQPSYAMPQFDYEGMMRQAQEQMRQYYQQSMPQVAPPPAVPMSAPQVAPRHRQPATPPAPPPSPQPAAPMPSPRVQDMFQAGGPMFTPFAFTMPMGPPSPADLPPEQRPPGFTQTFTDPFGNQTQNNPMAQRDALIQRINEQSLPYYMGGAGQFNPNLQDLWGQAGNMVENGWANPLAGLFG